jgi:hypothetical protein
MTGSKIQIPNTKFQISSSSKHQSQMILRSVWNFNFWDLVLVIWRLSKKAIGFPESQESYGV